MSAAAPTLILERPTLPEWIEKEILRLGGKTETGAPKYRLVWGASKICTPDDVTSYYQPDRWHLEKWIEGHYQHAYKFGYCPHMLPGQTKWCNACYLSGGEYFDLATHFRIVERCIRMFVLSQGQQNQALQKAALLEREAKAEEAKAKAMNDRIMGNLTSIDRVPHSLSPRGSKTLREVPMPKGISRRRIKKQGNFMQIEPRNVIK